MKTTQQTRETFRAAVKGALCGNLTEPTIYAEEWNGEMLFDVAARAAVTAHAIVWTTVEPDSFGELSGDPDDDAAGIENNCYEQAVQDVEDAAAHPVECQKDRR